MAIAMGPMTGGKPTGIVVTKTKEVAFIVDKSGSMESCRAQVISGFNEFVGDLQREKDLDIRFSATFFDTGVEQRLQGVPVSEAPVLTRENYTPGGCTALYDALGATLNKMEARLSGNNDTPIVVIVQTDGLENSSREFGQPEIAAKIKLLSARGNWTFVFMGADQDAWATAAPLGISKENTLSYASSNTAGSIGTTSSSTAELLRSGKKQTRSFYKP